MMATVEYEDPTKPKDRFVLENVRLLSRGALNRRAVEVRCDNGKKFTIYNVTSVTFGTD